MLGAGMSNSKSKINRLTSASLDLEKCLRFLDELGSQQYGTLIYEALLISAIVFYIRPFSQNETKHSTSPSDPKVSEEVLANLSEDKLCLHKRLKELRNKAIAHAEWTFHPTGVTENKVIEANPFSIWRHFSDSGDILAFQILARTVRCKIQNAQANTLHELP
jgi:hypothetical protein